MAGSLGLVRGLPNKIFLGEISCDIRGADAGKSLTQTLGCPGQELYAFGEAFLLTSWTFFAYSWAFLLDAKSFIVKQTSKTKNQRKEEAFGTDIPRISGVIRADIWPKTLSRPSLSLSKVWNCIFFGSEFSKLRAWNLTKIVLSAELSEIFLPISMKGHEITLLALQKTVPLPTKCSTKTPQKRSGKIRSRIRGKIRDKNSKNSGNFRSATFWPNTKEYLNYRGTEIRARVPGFGAGCVFTFQTLAAGKKRAESPEKRHWQKRALWFSGSDLALSDRIPIQ